MLSLAVLTAAARSACSSWGADLVGELGKLWVAVDELGTLAHQLTRIGGDPLAGEHAPYRDGQLEFLVRPSR